MQSHSPFLHKESVAKMDPVRQPNNSFSFLKLMLVSDRKYNLLRVNFTNTVTDDMLVMCLFATEKKVQRDKKLKLCKSRYLDTKCN